MPHHKRRAVSALRYEKAVPTPVQMTGVMEPFVCHLHDDSARRRYGRARDTEETVVKKAAEDSEGELESISGGLLK